MSEVITVSVTIPDIINLEYIIPALSAICAEKVRETVRQIERDRQMEEAIESDEALDKWMSDHWHKNPPPYVRACTYGHVYNRQEIGEFWHSRFQSNPRRPVVMRGAVEMLQRKYTIKSGYCEDVVERYLRRIRFTSIDRQEIVDTIDNALRRAMRLYEHHRNYQRGGAVYIDGERKYLSDEQLAEVKKLHAVATKVSKLEARIIKETINAT